MSFLETPANSSAEAALKDAVRLGDQYLMANRPPASALHLRNQLEHDWPRVRPNTAGNPACSARFE
jgi:hypothetical protein